MNENVVKCLLFWRDGQPTPSGPALRGVRVTRVAAARACADSLASHHWDCLVLDAVARSDDALDLLRQSRRTYPDVPVLVLVAHGDTRTAVEAMKAGAAHCLETPLDADRLLSVVRALCRHASRESLQGWARLTPIERTVLWHLLEGRTNQQIADLLCRSHRTIEVHRRHIMAKLHATNVVELVKRSIQVKDALRMPMAPSSAETTESHAESSEPESNR